MSERDLMRAVRAAPDDDAPRVAYAAAIDTTDPDRARFIRAQLDASHKRRAGASWGDELRTIEALLARHQAAWTPALPVPVASVGFFRGFVELVAMPAAAFVASADAIAQVVPLRHAELTGAHGAITSIVASSGYARLVSLGLSRNGLDDADAAALAAAPAGRLRWLDLSSNRIGDAGLDAIAGSASLRALEFLELGGNPCGEPADKAKYDEQGMYDAWPTPEGRALEARHGVLPWLHNATRHKTTERGDY
jgi:uncharacterized protein (TIGR02996 family)